MPYKPLKPCRCAGCPNLTDGTYCDKHKELLRLEKARPSAHKRGYSGRWQKARRIFLADNPLCVECKKNGRLTEATVVDHIIPHKGDDGLFWDRNNWQALCKECHDRKTVLEDGGFGNRIKRRKR